MFTNRILLRAGMQYRGPATRVFAPFRPAFSRYFSTGINSSANDSETIIEDQHFYSPSKNIDISKGSFTVFDNTKLSKGQHVAPYEVKETIIKNSIGVFVTMIIDNAFFPMYFVPTTFFALNMVYRASQYMTRAVNQVSLQS